MEKGLDITKVFHLLNLAACVSLIIPSSMVVTAADVEGC